MLYAAKGFFDSEAKSKLPTGFTTDDQTRLLGLVDGLLFEAVSREVDAIGERQRNARDEALRVNEMAIVAAEKDAKTKAEVLAENDRLVKQIDQMAEER